MKGKLALSTKGLYLYFKRCASVQLAFFIAATVLCNFVLWTPGTIPMSDVQRVMLSLMTVGFILVSLASVKCSTRDRVWPGWVAIVFLLLMLVPAIGIVSFPMWEYVVVATVGVLISIPFILIIVKVASCSRFALFTSLAHVVFGLLALGMLFPESDLTEIRVLVLLPVAVIVPASFGTVLVFGAYWVARHFAKCRIWGPLFNALLMAVFVLPIAASAAISVDQSGISSFWKTFCAICVSLVFGNVVAVPFGQFLRDFAQLSLRANLDEDETVVE